jgi:hypothetical protein
LLARYRAVADLGKPWVYVYFAVVGLGAAMLLGCTVWIVWQLAARTRRKRERRERHSRNPSQLTREQQEREIEENLQALGELRENGELDAEARGELEPMVQRFEDKRQARKLEIVAFGTVSSGKSSLLNALAGRDVFATDPRGGTTLRCSETPWPGMDRVLLVDTPGLSEVEGEARAAASADAAEDADLVLLAIDGPLRHSEFTLLERLSRMEKRIVVCLNKEDWYGTEDRERLLQQVREQTQSLLDPRDVVAVRSRPTERIRLRQLPDGTEQEEPVPVPADIVPLAERLMQIVRREGEDLLLANLLLQSRGMVDEARQRLRDALDRRAWQIVDRYMWGAGGVAAASPFPIVDIVAGCAVSSRMVVELGRVYRQEVDIEVAVKLLGQLGKNLLAILGVSAATPAVATIVASLLKTVPGAGTIAGGLLQGIVQALVTRWIGAVFITYFRNEMQRPEGGLAGLARRQWQQVTRVDELRKLVAEARRRWGTGQE